MNEINKYLTTIMQELNTFTHLVDDLALEQAADIIVHAEKHNGRVHVCGIGKPSYVAGYTASLLSSTGTKAYVLHGTEAVHGSSGQVAPEDVVIAISNSGETAELKETVKTVKALGARLIAVTRSRESWLAKQAEVVLLASVEQEGDTLNKPPRASILVETIILQGLSILLQVRKGLSPEDYVKWHPGGTLGASIREELK